MPSVLGSPVIIDCGSGITKAGTIDDDIPTAIFPSVVARRKDCLEETLVGSQVQSGMSNLLFDSPVHEGVVQNWEDVERLWRFSFELIKENPEDHSVLLSDCVQSQKLHRELTAQIMFESLGVQGLFLAPSTLLSLYSSGKISGVVVECGHEVTSIAPYIDGMTLPHSIQKYSLGGRILTEIIKEDFGRVLEKSKAFDFFFKGTELQTFRAFQDVKEKLAQCLPLHQVGSARSAEKATYELPDGKTIDVPLSPLVKCGEVFFNPQICNNDFVGIHESILNSVMNFDIDGRKDLFGNIVLCGGTGMMKGLADRIQEEVLSISPWGTDVSVSAQADRHYSAWIGGQILAGMNLFDKLWCDKAEYDESGNILLTSRFGRIILILT
jgi:actin-related protein